MTCRHPRRAGAAPVLALSLLLLPWHALRAQDLSFYEVGARAAAMGGAFTALADDITAVFYNPAGLAFLDGLRLKTNLTFAHRTIGATRSDTGLTFPTNQIEFRGSHFLAWRPAKGIGLGIGFYSPYNFETRWPRTWSGEASSVAARLSAETFRTAVAVEPVKGLAFGASLDIVSLHAGWEHKIFFDLDSYPLTVPSEVTSLHEVRGHGLGWSAGVLWRTIPWLRLGARFQQSVKFDLRGVNDFIFDQLSLYDTLPAPDRPFRYLSDFLDMFYAEQTVKTRMTLPREIACGLALTPVRNLTLSLDLAWSRWSELGPWQFTSVNEGGDLNPEFTPEYREFYGIEPNYGVQGFDLGLVDTRDFKAGIEYKLGRWFAFRGGLAKLASSVDAAGRTPLYPDPGFTVYSFGAGYEGPLFAIWDSEQAVSMLSLDFFVRYAASGTVTTPLPSFDLIYHADRFVAGVGVGFIF
jgi:long-subunit fatty acid transport protein